MNSSSQRVLLAVLAIVLGGGTLLVLFNTMFWSPYREARSKLTALSDEVDVEQRKQQQANFDKIAVAKWVKLSLPNSFDRASAEYGKMLKPLLRDCGLTVEDFKGPPPQEQTSLTTQKKAKHIVLTYQVRAKGTIESLTKTLEALQRMPLAHRVNTLVVDRIDPKDKTGKLGVNMTIEALIVAGTNNQPKMTPSDLAGAAPTKRLYGEVALRNPFVGYVPPPPPPPPPTVVKKEDPVPVEPEPTGPDPKEFIRLDTITIGDGEGISPEAFLINMAQRTPPLRLRSAPMSGYDTFRIMDEDRTKTLLKAKVLKIDSRDVYFQVGEEVFAIHFNQTLADALRRPLSDAQLERLDLTSLVDPEFGKAEKKGKTSSKKGR